MYLFIFKYADTCIFGSTVDYMKEMLRDEKGNQKFEEG